MKYKITFLALVSLFLIKSSSNCAQLDIGEDINFEYRYMEREGSVLSSEFRQRIKFYLQGYLRDNIEVGARFHSAGIMNSTGTTVVYDGAKIQNLTPFFELAYIKMNKYYGYPVSIGFGKLPVRWADGLLIDHNQLGLPTIYIEGETSYGITLEGYHCRTRDNLLNISGIKGYGIRAIKEFGFRRLELDYTFESYRSTKNVKRAIYGGNFTRNLTKGLEYSLFGYLMKGEKGGQRFTGHALGAYGKFEGVVEPLGKGGAWIRYILGTGDENDDEQGFLPILSNIEADMIGDFYGRFREYRMVDGSVSSGITLSHSIANLSVLRNALYATIRDDVSVFMIRSTYKKHVPNLPLGGALTVGVLYKYSLIDFELRYTVFTPEDQYDYYTGDKPTEFLAAGIRARF